MLKHLKFNLTLDLNTVLLVASLFVSTGMLVQKVHYLAKEQDRQREESRHLAETVAAMDDRNNEAHQEISKTLVGATAMINLHINDMRKQP